MSLPKAQVLAVVASSVASITLTLGAMVLLNGPKPAQASTATPEATFATGTSVSVRALPGRIASVAPKFNVIAIPHEQETLPDGSIDAAAIAAGFRQGGYSFTVRTQGFPSFSAASPLETGVVPDARHYILEWPGGNFISRYVRNGDDRTAWIGKSVLDLAAGDGWERTPDEMLPVDFYAAAIDPWTSALPTASSDGVYIADPKILAALANATSSDPAGWELTVTIDAAGRLTAARFSGTVGGQPFLMDIAVTYDSAPVPSASAVPTGAAPSAGH